MRALPRLLALGGAALLAAVGTAGCSGPAPAPARVVVRVAPSAHPVDLEVHLAQPTGAFRSVHRLRSGQTRSFAVPAGWTTVRVPGLCVVPARTTGTAVVEVDPDGCRLL